MIKKNSENKIVKNIGWLVVDKFLILFLQFFVGVKIANYYGSEIYGKYLYAVSVLAFSPIFLEILNSRVIKKSFLNYKVKEVIESVCTLKTVIAVTIFLIILSSKYFIRMDNELYLLLILLGLDNVFLVSSNGIELYFEYKLNSKYVVISNNVVKIISYILQYIAINYEMKILFIPIIRCFGNILRFYIMKFNFNNIYKEKLKLKVTTGILKEILNESKYLWLTYASFVVYTQIDKIMIGNMIGNKEVGLYSLANQLITMLGILLMPINVSLFPKLLDIYTKNKKEYLKIYEHYNSLVTSLYIFLSVASMVVLKYLFPLVYSKEYFESIRVYNILIIGTIFTANASLQAGHIAIINKTKQSMYKTLIGMLLNIILNIYLIKQNGVYGAAISTVITTIVCNFGLDFFIKDYREHAIIQLKSFNIIKIFDKRKCYEK